MALDVKAVANEETLLRKHCCERKCFGEQTGKHLLRTQNVSERQMLRARANGETFAAATMFPRLPRPLRYKDIDKFRV